jgi:hypothetical protein
MSLYIPDANSAIVLLIEVGRDDPRIELHIAPQIELVRVEASARIAVPIPGAADPAALLALVSPIQKPAPKPKLGTKFPFDTIYVAITRYLPAWLFR